MQENMTKQQAELYNRVLNDFDYHKVPIEEQPKLHEIRGVTRTLAQTLIRNVPPGRELSSALTNLEQAMFHANAGISRQYPVEPSTTT